MCDEVVQASPVNKRKRRRRRRWVKSAKQTGGSDDSSYFEITASTSKTTLGLSTISEESFAGVAAEAPLDISKIYGSQAIEDEVDVGNGGILSYVNLLEKAALQGSGRRICSQEKKKATKTFTAACDLPELQEASCQVSVAYESQPDASAVSDTQVLRLCEAADIIEEIKRSNIELSSQWESPGRKTQGVSTMDTVVFNSQEPIAQEILRDCISQPISESSQRPEDFPPPPQPEPQSSRAPDTYSRLKARRQKDRQTPRRLAYDYDSDSKSSLSSELSVQNDEILECTPTDCGDLHKSLRVCENLQNLSSFFSQSFNPEEHDATADGVYRHIMALKAKRWEARLFDWYNNARNFNVPDDKSSANFEGFGDSEIEPLSSESSCKSKDISTFLDDDDELFQEVRATYLANNLNQATANNMHGKIQGPSGGALNEVKHAQRITEGTLDNPVTNQHKISAEKSVARTGNNNFAIPNHNTPCKEELGSSHLPINIEMVRKYENLLPGSPRESQIWPDEKLLCEISTPLATTNLTIKSVKELNNSKIDENENNTKFIQSSMSSIRTNFREENLSSSVRSCRFDSFKVKMGEKPVISPALKEKGCKPVIETQTANLLKGASQWNANTSFTGCEAAFKKEINVLKMKTERSSEAKLADENNFKIPEGNTSSVAFHSARGKAINISEEGMLKAKSLWAEVENFSQQDLGNEEKNMSVIKRHCTESQSLSVLEINKENVFKQPCQEAEFAKSECANDQKDKTIEDDSHFSGYHPIVQSANLKKNIRNELKTEHNPNFVRNFNESKNFIGFTSLSGKPILVSKEAKERASRILSDVDDLIRDEFDQDPIKRFEENIGFTGFKSVSGKPILVSKEAANKAGNLFAEVVDAFIQDETKQDPLKILEDSKGFTGFKSVTAKSTTVSNETTNIASTILSDADNFIRDEIDQSVIKDFNETRAFTGFKSVSGKTITISKEATNRANNLFAEIDAFSREEVNRDPLRDFEENRGFTGFKSVSGRPILVSKQAQNIASNLLFEVDASIEKSEKNEVKPISRTPFSIMKMSSEKDYILSEHFKTKLDRAQPAFESYSNQGFLKEFNSEKSNLKATMTGFTTVSGKAVKISTEGKSIADKLLSELNSWNEQDLLINVKGKNTSAMTNSSKPTIENITPETQKMYNRFNEKENVTQIASTSEIGIVQTQSLNLINRGNSLKRSIGLNSENTPGKSIATHLGDDKPAKRLKSNKYLPIPVTISTSRSDVASMNSNSQRNNYNGPEKQFIRNNEKLFTPVKTQSAFQQCHTPDLKEFFNSVETSTPRTIKRQTNFSLTQEISASTAALAEDELKSSTVADDFHTIKWDDFEDSFNDKSHLEVGTREEKNSNNKLIEKVSELIISNREPYRQKCEQIIKDKINCPRIMSPGELFITKVGKDRQKLKDVVGNHRPTFLTEEELVKKGVLPEVAQLTFSQAADFKFSEPLEGRTVIFIQENTFIIPDDYNKIGLHEIKQCFLTKSGVYESLLPHGWVDHHFKMILLKLATFEKAFPQYFAKQICTPDNIISQLKYRYDREIDRAERSCLKKILESDDSAAKRMVLLVLDIHENNGEIELELTDWWYSVRATVDLAMVNLVRLGKVRIGTKLMIQGAKLVNCDSGCDPLQLPSLVRLKIHTNSCRRTVWDLKLGFFKIPKPFYISLDEVKENGGLVLNLNLHILRVYPTVFLNRTGGSSQGVHSQKVEERLRKTEEKIDFDNFEMIFSQVQHELQQEMTAKRKRVNCLSIVTDPEELYKLIDEGYNLEDIEIDLPPDELNKIMQHQQDVSSRKMDEVNRRVKEKLKEQSEKRSSTELIRIRVIDDRHPKSTAVLSIWRPSENLRELFKEGTSIEVTNCVPSGVRYGDMQLNSTKNSEFTFVSKKLTISGKQDLLRRVTTIKEIASSNFAPIFNEVDTFGFIVMISNMEQRRKFQSVFLCDAEENLLCINFWNGVKEYAYEDVIQEGRFISAINLQTRANSKTGVIPCLFATEISIFTENPKAEDMSNALATFRSSLNDTNLSTLSSNCVDKIENLKNSNASGNSFATPVRKSLSLCSGLPNSFNNTFEKHSPGIYSTGKSPSIPTPQNRIERLGVYGQPPDLSPINFEIKPRVRSGFKLPRKLEENNQNDSTR